jgi:hypothetical protein
LLINQAIYQVVFQYSGPIYNITPELYHRGKIQPHILRRGPKNVWVKIKGLSLEQLVHLPVIMSHIQHTWKLTSEVYITFEKLWIIYRTFS